MQGGKREAEGAPRPMFVSLPALGQDRSQAWGDRETTASAILWGYYGASVPEYWDKVEAGEKVQVPAGYIEKAERMA